MNITSPSSSLEQINFALEDRGTNPSNSSINFSFRTCSVAMEGNGSGCGCGLGLVSVCLLFFIEGLSLVKNVQTEMDEVPVSEFFKPYRYVVSPRLFCSGLKVYHLPPASSVREDAYSIKVVSEQDELPSSVQLDFRARLNGVWMVEVTKLTTGRLVNGSSCDGIDMVIKNLDLKPKIDAMMRDFLE
ncbi:hypothetical protein Tco_0629510 [Tanacetum coccineum]|uniref:Uncharacterized protein n=1 Tax=Tanacetum coccineum TaxID=301880 RepID=A0ABQ4WTM1_9ASTR